MHAKVDNFWTPRAVAFFLVVLLLSRDSLTFDWNVFRLKNIF